MTIFKRHPLSGRKAACERRTGQAGKPGKGKPNVPTIKGEKHGQQ